MKDTKLISKIVRLETLAESEGISARRLRNDECYVKAIDGDVVIGSYIETGDLNLETRNGNILINKKLGINKKGLLKSAKG